MHTIFYYKSKAECFCVKLKYFSPFFNFLLPIRINKISQVYCELLLEVIEDAFRVVLQIVFFFLINLH